MTQAEADRQYFERVPAQMEDAGIKPVNEE